MIFKVGHFEKSGILNFFSKKNQNGRPPKVEQLLPKFHRFVLGLAGLIDAKGTDVAQPIWP